METLAERAQMLRVVEVSGGAKLMPLCKSYYYTIRTDSTAWSSNKYPDAFRMYEEREHPEIQDLRWK